MTRRRSIEAKRAPEMAVPPSAAAPVVFATRPGGTTIDRDAAGGNPFATALIELSHRQHRTLGAFSRQLLRLTQTHSGGHQSPVGVDVPADGPCPIGPAALARSRGRLALVLIVSEYPGLQEPTLLGAAWDERRIAAMLAQGGYSVEQGVGGDRASLLAALRRFAARSPSADSAVVYCTGHGVEWAGETFLLPGDYPFASGYSKALLRAHAVPVARLRDACRAERCNLCFFAGCRSTVG